jgi:hypothetical protein
MFSPMVKLGEQSHTSGAIAENPPAISADGSEADWMEHRPNLELPIDNGMINISNGRRSGVFKK